jgi:sugar lactone lactonase YvrE
MLGDSTRSLTAALLTAGLVATPVAHADAAQHAATRTLPRHNNLPDGFQPEGITIRGGPRAYLGSRADGDIYAANLRTGRGRVISQGDGTPAVGLKLDARKRLWVAGGDDGDAKVVNARNGRVLAHYDFTAGDSFVNDVLLRKGSAWFTDSRRAVLYRVTPHNGQAQQASVRTVPLGGAWTQVPDVNNANGISTTPDGRALLVIQSANGFLFRVDPRSGNATRVALGGATLVNGDGLLRRGRLLYAAQNRDNKVAVIRLGKHGRAGRLVRTRTSSDFDVPSTIASWRSGLYLPNARFTTPATPTTAYWITRVRP